MFYFVLNGNVKSDSIYFCHAALNVVLILVRHLLHLVLSVRSQRRCIGCSSGPLLVHRCMTHKVSKIVVLVVMDVESGLVEGSL